LGGGGLAAYAGEGLGDVVEVLKVIDHVLAVFDASPILVEKLVQGRAVLVITAMPNPLVTSRMASRPPKPKRSFCRSPNMGA